MSNIDIVILTVITFYKVQDTYFKIVIQTIYEEQSHVLLITYCIIGDCLI